MVLLVVSDVMAASREKRLLFVGSEDRHPFNGLCFQDNLGKPAPDSSSLNQSVFNLARGDGGWQWHQLDHMQIICALLQTDKHTSNPSVIFLQQDALPDAQPTVSVH